MSVTVYKYGARRHNALPYQLPDEVTQQIFLAHALREALVDLDLAREQQLKDMWSSFPAVAESEQALADAEARVVELVEIVKKARSEQRTRAPKTHASEELTLARAAAKEAKQTRRDQIAAVAEQSTQIRAHIMKEYKAGKKALYADYVQTRGLYWATFNDVTDHHNTTMQRIGKDRAAGRPAQLKHHRFDGSGTIAVQLQQAQPNAEKGVKGDPRRSPELIASGTGKWRNVLRVTPWIDPDEFAQMTRPEQRRLSRGHVAITIGGGQIIEIPTIVHRMLPADADITGARLTATRIGSSLKVTIAITAKVADPIPVTEGPDIAVHFGWRRIAEDGSLRVATWRASDTIDIPENLRHIITADTPTSGHIVLPGTWRDAQARFIEAQSARDTMFDEARALLLDWLTHHQASTETDRHGNEFQVSAANVAQWRSPGRLASLLRRWSDLPKTGTGDLADADDLLDALETWRANDKKVWNRQAHGRDKSIGRRDDAWRNVAAWLSNRAGRVILDDTDLTKLARNDNKDNPTPTNVTVIPSRQRIDAAPGGLRDAIRAACVRDGVTIHTIPHKGLTRTHAACGHTNPVDDRYSKNIIVVCDKCGRRYDQDHNSTILMLTAAPRAVR